MRSIAALTNFGCVGKQAKIRQLRRQAGSIARADVLKFIDAFCVAAPSVFYRRLGIEDTLNANRIFTDACDAYGIDSEPISVSATAMNEKFWELWRANASKFPEDEVTQRSWWNQGAKMTTTLSKPTSSGAWNGHVVSLVEGHMVDPWTPRLRNDEYSITLEDVSVAPLGNDLFKLGQPMIAGNKFQTFVMYKAFPDDHAFRTEVEFGHTAANMDSTRELVLVLDQMLPAEWQARSRAKLARA